MKEQLEANNHAAIDFYRTAYLGNPRKAVEAYVGDQYVQHNPEVADGVNGFIDYFTRMAEEHPTKEIEFLRAVAEGDLVALHTHQTWPGNEQYVSARVMPGLGIARVLPMECNIMPNASRERSSFSAQGGGMLADNSPAS